MATEAASPKRAKLERDDWNQLRVLAHGNVNDEYVHFRKSMATLIKIGYAINVGGWNMLTKLGLETCVQLGLLHK
jgi:hypothetical protein